jgi:hypothetical protein
MGVFCSLAKKMRSLIRCLTRWWHQSQKCLWIDFLMDVSKFPLMSNPEILEIVRICFNFIKAMGLIVTRLTSLVYKRASSWTHPQPISRKSIFEVLHPSPPSNTPKDYWMLYLSKLPNSWVIWVAINVCSTNPLLSLILRLQLFPQLKSELVKVTVMPLLYHFFPEMKSEMVTVIY